ncbi:uncharacterized protein EDB91DRAFT_1147120 [Suillus paluster]|uniref:uncharacterized protein n=1 Tax=Suillus paluster TaxID=48578 RepID=UPI001B87CA7F|nr:uncharacterized protein EDB91DRAFT_1147120 [Suillus paluster]KAG1734259.1 hypothetical protein EDB91DRAFT_1147120 [Suillus paluster]
MDGLSMWEPVSSWIHPRTKITHGTRYKKSNVLRGRSLCKVKLTEQPALSRSQFFPSSPFSDDHRSPRPSTNKSLTGSHPHHSSSPIATRLKIPATTNAPTRNRSALRVPRPGKSKETRSKYGRRAPRKIMHSRPRSPENQHVEERQRLVDDCGLPERHKVTCCNR